MSKIQLVSINQRIEQLRSELLKLVSKHGFSHSKVIKCSQELDRFILEVQKDNAV